MVRCSDSRRIPKRERGATAKGVSQCVDLMTLDSAKHDLLLVLVVVVMLRRPSSVRCVRRHRCVCVCACLVSYSVLIEDPALNEALVVA